MFAEKPFPLELRKKLPGSQFIDSDDSRMFKVGTILQKGEIIDCKPWPKGSNCVFLLSLRREGENIRAIYKPRQGEIPLYDFPQGTLYQREYAAYLVSQALRWFLVPPTVIRDGPLGIGVLQWFVMTNAGTNYTELLKKRTPEFKRIAAFDWLINNADRKGSHCLEGTDGRLWLIDHGLTFHIIPKLRTVIWDFSEEPIPEELLPDLGLLYQQLTSTDSDLTAALSRLLTATELEALGERLTAMLRCPVFPSYFGPYHDIPWPPY